jgi:hypothetical protein
MGYVPAPPPPPPDPDLVPQSIHGNYPTRPAPTDLSFARDYRYGGDEWSGHVFAAALLIFLAFFAIVLLAGMNPAAQMIALFLGSFGVGITLWRWLARDDEPDSITGEKPKRVIDDGDLEKPKRSEDDLPERPEASYGTVWK